MAANTNPIFGEIPFNAPVTIVPADTTTKKTVYTGPADGCRIETIRVTSDDTAAVTLMWYLTIGGTDYHIGTTVIPIGSGYTTVAAVDAIPTIGIANLRALLLANTQILKVAALATITAAKTVTIVAMGMDF